MAQPENKNEAIWDKLVQHDVLCSRPRFDLTQDSAREYLGRHQYYGDDLTGKNVLCLACGGGQQSLAFALLGARVTVVDFSAEQLQKDALVAEKFGQEIRLIKSDMRDLSMLETGAFDLVYQPYSINYVPSTEEVFNEVTRLLKPGGVYDLMFHNPYVHGTWKDGCWGSQWAPADLWEGKGYPLWQPYQDGYPIQTHDGHWNFENQAGESVKVESPQEYRHTLATVMNGLLKRGFEIVYVQEEVGTATDAEPGSWDHYQSIAPPWLFLISRKK